jgi:polyisoprenoid-binding protein YceI
VVRETGRPRGRRLALIVGGGLVVTAIAAFLLVYFVLFPTSSPKPFKLAPSDTAATSTSTTSTSAPVAGTWKIASGSLAGYRVREKLAFLPAQSDAVGRTSQVSGNAAITTGGGSLSISSAAISVAVNTLKSDRSMRDEKIRQIGLESERFPTATFALASPLKVSLSAVRGHVAHVRASGLFEIHGVSRKESIPLELSLSGSTLEAAGSLTFPWSRFGMTAPSIGGFVNVTEHATLEFDLRLSRS